MKMQVFYWPREVWFPLWLCACALIYLYFWQQGLGVKKNFVVLKPLCYSKLLSLDLIYCITPELSPGYDR